ncbi:alpha-glucuronidase family glycosyl hydrolase [Roseivirga sp. BDSF3-8]|uniref:alpha-glucuronidase family glycosyl hydrolase n=1 Tax=Roseivirga sp. BDSF3-8 TaxID=3241598 RepID=UPI0035324908
MQSIPSIHPNNLRLFSLLLLLFLVCLTGNSQATDGYNLWLTYRPLQDKPITDTYKKLTEKICFPAGGQTLEVARDELDRGLSGMLGTTPSLQEEISDNATLILATYSRLPARLQKKVGDMEMAGEEGYLLKVVKDKERPVLVISANTDTGLLYGTFHLLRLMQTEKSLENMSLVQTPKTDIRVLNHWDNLDRTVERGYAGFSIWNWHKLPEYIDQRYIDYARANASIGINGTVLTNVNANALVLTPAYLQKVKALADVFRPYSIKVYLTARFSAPIETGGLDTADPLNEEVGAWWQHKAAEIYDLIPDFGGFLVKANSEGQPGPQNYGRNHADGANMLAKAVAPHGGIVMWRAFVYSEHDVTDRAMQAYSEFVPYDGQFADNVLIQVKNGAIDFQPREPFHPMFGAMPDTPLMMEFQITQEYLGFSTHLVFLPKMYEEVLDADTYRDGKEATVAKVIDGTLTNKELTGIAGVANIGTDRNWTGHPFGQANWYGFGRLAWNPYLSSEEIAAEWLQMTFSNDEAFVTPMTDMLVDSRETVVKYMTPLGLHHIMDAGHHYGPGPWIKDMPRPDWTSVYYHKADSAGIGFDRTVATGSGATAQYAPEVAEIFNDAEETPRELLLWFHHLPWGYKMENGRTLWQNLGLTYQEGVDEVKEMEARWEKMAPYVNKQQHEQVSMLLDIQLKEAKWWKNACMTYFQQFSGRPFPEGMEKPEKPLSYYQSLSFPYAPGIRPSWD